MSSKNRIRQVIEVSTALFTLITLTMDFRVILAPLNHTKAVTLGAANTRLPAKKAHGFVAFGIINQMGEVQVEHNGRWSGSLLVGYQPLAWFFISPKHLLSLGFNFKLVLADSLYGDSSNFLSVLNQLKLDFVVAIRSNHGVWLPEGVMVRHNRWRPYERIFSDGTRENRYIQEIIFGKRRQIQYWQVTTDPETLPKNSTWLIMTKVPGIKYTEVGNLYGLKNWVEYGLKQSKNELGWADFRVTDYAQIEKWWQIVMSAYLMVSLHAQVLNNPDDKGLNQPTAPIGQKFREHEWWDKSQGWKNLLNNLRLVIQPLSFFNLIKPWLQVFPISPLSIGFST